MFVKDNMRLVLILKFLWIFVKNYLHENDINSQILRNVCKKLHENDFNY